MSDRELRIRMLLEGVDKLTKPMRAAVGGSAQLSRELKTTQDRLRELKAASSQVEAFRLLKKGVSDTADKMAAARAKATELGRSLALTERPTRAMRTEFNRARKEAEGLTNQHRNQHAQLTALRGKLDAAGISTRDLANQERRLRTETQQANDALADQRRRLEVQSRHAAGREQFSKMQGNATSLAAGGAAAVGTGMMIARPLQATTDDAMEFESMMTDINQKVNQTRAAGQLMSRTLRQTALDTNQYADEVARGVDVLTGFGLASDKAMAMTKLNGKAATAYKADIADLSAATFAAHDNLQVPINQVGKAIDVMAHAGKEGAFEVKDMAQYFPALTSNLKSLGSQGVPAVADLAAALQITRKGAGDAAAAATNLDNLLSKMNTEETTKKFAELGINVPAALKKAVREGRSPLEEFIQLTRRATGGDNSKIPLLFGDMQVQKAIRPLIDNFDEYLRIRNESLGASGVVDADFAERMQDSAEKTKHLTIQARDARIVIGEQLKPVVDDVSTKMSEWADRTAEFASENPKLTRTLAVSAAVMAGLFIVIGGLAIAAAALILPFAMLAGASTVLGIGMLPLLGISLLVLAGIGLLAAAAYLIYDNWDGISAWFGKIWAEIKGYVDGGLAGIGELFVNFSPLGLLYAGFAALLDYFGINVPSRLSQAGRAMMDGLIAGITAKVEAVKATMRGLADDVSNWFREKLGIHSPSRVFAGLGAHVMAGLDQGLAAGAGGPLSRIADLSGQMTRALAIGAGAGAIAAAAPAAAGAPGSSQAGAAVQNSYSYSITIQAGSGQPQEIAQAVREAIEKIERERRGRGFGDD